MLVGGIATQSRADSEGYNQWVSSYLLHYSVDCVNFTPFFNEALEEKVNSFCFITFHQ